MGRARGGRARQRRRCRASQPNIAVCPKRTSRSGDPRGRHRRQRRLCPSEVYRTPPSAAQTCSAVGTTRRARAASSGNATARVGSAGRPCSMRRGALLQSSSTRTKTGAPRSFAAEGGYLLPIGVATTITYERIEDGAQPRPGPAGTVHRCFRSTETLHRGGFCNATRIQPPGPDGSRRVSWTGWRANAEYRRLCRSARPLRQSWQSRRSLPSR